MAKQKGKDLFSGDVPQMPDGYYSGGKPNLNLRAFVEAHEKVSPYNAEKDRYSVTPVLQSMKVKRSTKVFNMHTYWSKKPHESIEAYVKHYTKEDDLVLDPFCGSGGTVLVAVNSGRKAIGIDLSPAATFFTATLCAPPKLDEFRDAFESIMKELINNYSWIYEFPYQGKTWPIHFGISSMRFKCIKCLRITSLFRCVGDDEAAKCPFCNETIKTTQEKFGYQLDEWHLFVKHGVHHVVKIEGNESAFEKNVQERINSELKKHVPPKLIFPKQGRTQVLAVRGIAGIEQLYTQRNLLALCAYRDACLAVKDERLRNSLLFVLTAVCLKTSRMMGLNADGIGRIQKNGLIAQLIVKDVNVFDFLEIAHKGILGGYEEILSENRPYHNCLISTQTAIDLSAIESNAVDYIFTDPPYGSRVQFWESNQVWEAWLGLNTKWQDMELIVNRIRGLGEDYWQRLFHEAMQECYRVLKPGRWITLTYNDRETWPLLQDVMLEVGFIPDGSDSPIAMETTAKSEKQMKGEDNTLRDLIINFRKPKPGEIASEIVFSENEDETTFSQKALTIIVDLLSSSPGSSKNRIHDTLVSRMVRKGELEHHDFEGLLRQVADEAKEPVKKTLYENEDPNIFGTHEVSRWYLKENEFAETDAAESAKEDDAAEKVEKFIEKKIKEQPWLEGVHYSDIFEQYIYSVKDKPRRQLAEWLLDYFYKTDAGTYRLPQSDEEKKLKAEGRAKGTHRRVKRFIAYLQQGVAIPAKEQPNDATLAEWLRYCKRSGLYEQGKLLYEKGGLNLDNLSEKDMVNAEEDYQVCVRLLARGAAGSGAESVPKHSRKKK